MKFFLSSTAFMFFVTFVNCNLTVEYYTKLIKENIEKAGNYSLPESNEEFRKGFESNEVSEFGNFDFIIIGAGSAGSVLATRLSEIDDWNILLIEAGDEEDDFSRIPRMWLSLPFTEKNWGYSSISQKNCCLGMKNQQCRAARGKSIGGTSAINGMVYSRGNSKDYEKWVELGNTGWSYNEVLPYFIKSENSQIDGDSGYHGKGGFWNFEYSVTMENDIFVEANLEANQSFVDYNGRRQIGFSNAAYDIKHGKRESLATAFLDNSRKRKNLKVLAKALATKIDIDKDEKIARDVEFVMNNQKFRATAEREVIVSGGAINSPQLLILSGIGPKHHLDDLGIELIEDLPVGENLIDHVATVPVYRTNLTFEIDLEEAVEEYLNGFGVLTASSGAIGFIHRGDLSDGVPMIQYMLGTPDGMEIPASSRFQNYKEEITNALKENPKTDFQLFVILLHEKSRGRITLKSKSPIDFPNIDYNFFAESEDIDNMIEGVEFISKLMQTEAFKRINATLLDIPVCQNFEKNSRSFSECSFRQMAVPYFHICGTTRMGPNKASAVVDSDLKVHGIEKLRVIDAGIFPSSVSGNTNGAVVMVAEKMSDSIKREYGKL